MSCGDKIRKLAEVNNVAGLTPLLSREILIARKPAAPAPKVSDARCIDYLAPRILRLVDCKKGAEHVKRYPSYPGMFEDHGMLSEVRI